jgi:Ca-activated chloride channel family protein
VTIDKASYSNVRRFLNMGSTIPPDAVRIEELLNYFNFGYTDPPGDSCFALRSDLSECPWNPADRLLFLKVCARKLDPANSSGQPGIPDRCVGFDGPAEQAAIAEICF